MDFKEYNRIYHSLLNDNGLVDIGSSFNEKATIVDNINKFLELYPKSIPKDRNPEAYFYELSVIEIYRRFIRAAIHIIEEISELISQKKYVSAATFRRELFQIFTKKERRLYVGLWLIFLSFILYFIDSAA